jgi:hypothetical protein
VIGKNFGQEGNDAVSINVGCAWNLAPLGYKQVGFALHFVNDELVV